MALVLTITTGRVDRERAEAFQTTFRSLMGRRFAEAPFLRQAMLVHLGDDVWQMLTIWESDLALVHGVDNDTPLTVRIFREFGAEPEIRLADVSAFLQPPPEHELRVLEEDQTVPPRPEEEAAAAARTPDDPDVTHGGAAASG